ncbi:hypothetical protein KR200_001644, partial [Drosophila serrata]
RKMEDYSYTILILGDAGVGKSALFSRAMEGTFDADYYSPAITQFKNGSVRLAGKKILLSTFDVAGEDRFRIIHEELCGKVQGVILVFDTTSRSSFQNMPVWGLRLVRDCIEGVNIMIVGTKCDELEARQVTQEEAAYLADEFQISYVETSAMTGHNVKKVFNVMAAELYFRNVLKRVPPPWPESRKMAIALAQEE